MKILIIEDEVQAAWNLKNTILNVKPDASIIGVVDSLYGITEWFLRNEKPDLIFSDIQLGDGIVFDVYRDMTLPCPVIFCTAYDEYLLQAFKSNGIDYLLKPIDDKELEKSFEKLQMIEQSLATYQHKDYLDKAILEILQQKTNYKTNFLLPHRDRLIPVDTEQIFYFKIVESNSEIGLSNGKTYRHSFTLDYLVTVLDPARFYRLSRQYIVAFNAIYEIEHHEDRKLLIHLKEPCREKIIVSKAKASEFLSWVQKR
jgi:DNA-binding LytR/AlgR family response regulator